jgi:2-polyprenyl-3-methyl-5-hydroxy-6-metoxy-1,4-benzoquinol methylase
MKRIVEPEILDTLPPEDPRAIRSRRDLRRVNFWMRNHAIMANALKENFSGVPKQIVEIGAGDGNFLLSVAQKSDWRNTDAILLDLKKNISTETLAAFSKMNWRAEVIVADVFDWNGAAEIVIANLFLHHFENPKLAQLLQKISERAKLFVAVEPHRFYFPFPCAQMLRLIGCGEVTLHDAEASIRAGFIRKEISGLWPDKSNWQLTERRGGLFSHLFIAKKILKCPC